MQILITGVAGFIGFGLSRFLLKNSKLKIYGIDNINNYYSKKFKLKRIKELKKFKNFRFQKIDITNQSNLDKFFKKKDIKIVINLAAQAGVRYSLKKPSEFVSNNIQGFYNVVHCSHSNNVKKIVYASSSSVYGDTKNFPLKETYLANPKNIYSLSKKNNEEMAEIFSKQFKIELIGLRFFTVYGEWGRPDMFLMKYINSSFNPKKKFYLNNFGNHTRDFTYIQDVCKILEKLILRNKKKFNHEIFNICSNNPIKLTNIMKEINHLTKRKPKIYKRGLQAADVVKTHGSNKKILKIIGNFKFTEINVGLHNTIQWFKKHYKY